ncbi:uncharacterized protein LOC143250256 [Tachypleus tridentatus]|uniref:uncharacterized protein LOC143250256 n=1 Tax=Tachypleus tridentatus TaxID=6853 RepID=UPI003FD432DA
MLFYFYNHILYFLATTKPSIFKISARFFLIKRTSKSIHFSMFLSYTSFLKLTILLSLIWTSWVDAQTSTVPQRANGILSIFTSFAETIGRSVSTSQVLAINIKNFVIFLTVKAILILAGYFGFSSIGSLAVGLGNPTVTPYYYYPYEYENVWRDAKDLGPTKFEFTSEDMRWLATYIWSVNTDNYGCLNKLACENPKSAKAYITGGRILMNLVNYVKTYIDISPKYDKVLRALQDATSRGETQGNQICDVKYSCNGPFVRR